MKDALIETGKHNNICLELRSRPARARPWHQLFAFGRLIYFQPNLFRHPPALDELSGNRVLKKKKEGHRRSLRKQWKSPS